MSQLPDRPDLSSTLSTRRDYALGALIETDVLSDPIEQFARWFSETQSAQIPEPNAMTLATADVSGAPAARIVLLREFDARGFVFFTNYQSRKGRELEANPRACLLFFWQPLERQVRVEGKVERVSREVSEAYFHTRPLATQIAAWASHQSEVIPSRAELERRDAEFAARFGNGPVPLPDYWGGYRVVPDAMEFWQGRRSRLHDRLVYLRSEAGAWTLRRLSP